MTTPRLPRSESWAFTDPLTGTCCFLVIEPNGKPGIRHPGCPAPAALITELDAFYCLSCGSSGRIPGRWAAGIITARTTQGSRR